jgi:hypothetical protein
MDRREVGGLMSYETGLTEVFWQVGAHPVRILKGSKPADQKRTSPHNNRSTRLSRFNHLVGDGEHARRKDP